MLRLITSKFRSNRSKRSGAVLLSALTLLSACGRGQAAPGLPTLPDDQVTFAQMTDGRPVDLSRTGSGVGFIWGGGASAGARSVGSKYYPIDRDLNRAHDTRWFQANMPDGIVYKCDRQTPATSYTYAWGSYAPIDVSNPQVRQYVFNSYLAPALQSGTHVIALDNVTLRNESGRCGALRGGRWTPLYTGQLYDPAFQTGVMDWVRWLAGQIHARGGLLALNAKVDPSNMEATRDLIGLGDIWLEEAAFTRDCQGRVSDDKWQAKFTLAQWAAQRMGWVDLEKTCASPGQLSDDEAQWVAGNFLLARGPHSYLAAVHDGDPMMLLSYPRALNPPVGRAQGPAYGLPGGGMARRYSRGLVLVNPASAGSISVALPPGRWSDLNGRPAGGRTTLGPTTAAVLIGG